MNQHDHLRVQFANRYHVISYGAKLHYHREELSKINVANPEYAIITNKKELVFD